ncbi:MAG: holo-ACP synthase [Buchnera aphidicola (Tetraneura akinire)]
MSIFGIGIDLLEKNRIYKFSSVKQEKFSKKILSKNELREFNQKKNKKLFLSKYFTIKESISKAFGVGIQKDFFFKNFEIYHNCLGKPKITITGKPLKLFNKLKLKSIYISLTDEKKYVIAMTIIEK